MNPIPNRIVALFYAIFAFGVTLAIGVPGLIAVGLALFGHFTRKTRHG